jgi:hypothetical protein
MASIEEMQAQMAAHQAAQLVSQQETEKARREHEQEMEARRAKLELVRLAKEVLVENRRSAPADERDVTAQEITEFADTLASYVDA